MMFKYRIRLIHRTHDWDAEFTFMAPDARKARKWAQMKLSTPWSWLVVSAKRVKP